MGESRSDAWAGGLLASLPDSVFVLDAAGTLVFANEGVSRALGWKSEDWIGRNALEVVHPDDLAMALVSLESVGGKAVGSPIDIRLQTADGGWRYFEIVGANLLDDPEIAGIVVVARDLTERRRFEVATNDHDRFRRPRAQLRRDHDAARPHGQRHERERCVRPHPRSRPGVRDRPAAARVRRRRAAGAGQRRDARLDAASRHDDLRGDAAPP